VCSNVVLVFCMLALDRDVAARIISDASETARGTPTWEAIDDALKDPTYMQNVLATRPQLPWADQSQAEHDADLARTWRARTTANRRILQGADSDKEREAIMPLLPGPTAWCDDPLATNAGEDARCAYDCAMLQRHYFPGMTSRCFRYNAAAGGWPAALLSRKQASFNNTNFTIVVPNDENWIIQGALGPDSVPIKLDARLSSGSAIDFSEASIVVRHVRISGQNRRGAVAWNYTMQCGDKTRNGGAFSYHGGGLNPEAHTPKLVFEHVVFDRNEAVCSAAVGITGRANTMSSLDLVVDGCLFFRNVATLLGAGLAVANTIPARHLVNNTEFSQNSAFMFPHVLFSSNDAKVGVQSRRNTYTVANSHVDGGGIWSHKFGGVFFTASGAPTADGTIHEVLFERVTVVDITVDSGPYALSCLGNGLQVVHCVIRECQVARAVGVEGQHVDHQSHTIAVVLDSVTTCEISRLNLEASGSFVDASRGVGVLLFYDQDRLTGYPPGTEYRVVDSTFVHNQASFGGAFAVECIRVQVAVQRCFFQVGARRQSF
jgi:hypothetical protein